MSELKATLLSEQFCNVLQGMFDELGETIVDKRMCDEIYRAYYVMKDLKNGFQLDQITKSRLNDFHTVLWGYRLNYEDDELAERLFEAVETELTSPGDPLESDEIVKCTRCKNKHKFSERKPVLSPDGKWTTYCCPRCNAEPYYKIPSPQNTEQL